jgi:hypothetical protein
MGIDPVIDFETALSIITIHSYKSTLAVWKKWKKRRQDNRDSDARVRHVILAWAGDKYGV